MGLVLVYTRLLMHLVSRPRNTMTFADGSCEATSVSLVVADVPASPPPRSLISPRKTHQQMSWYSWDETLPTTVTSSARH